MGLFSFLSQVTGNRGKSKPARRAQPYVPSLSPSLRIPGEHSTTNKYTDSPRALEDTELTGSQHSLDTVSEGEEPAPAPGIPRCREEDMRPNTAPTKRPASLVPPAGAPQLLKSSHKRPPPLAFRFPRPDSVVSRSRPDSRASVSTTTSAFRRGSALGRVDSLRSDGGGAFKDILDAQSEIRPADFRARVRAAGARDYGEDVAERNLGENGIDLGSEHVRAFYARSTQPQPAERRRVPGETELSVNAQKPSSRGPFRFGQETAARQFPLRNTVSASPKPIRRRDTERSQSVSSSFTPAEPGQRNNLQPVTDSPEDFSPRTPALDVGQLDSGLSALKLVAPVLPRVPEAAPAPTIRTARLPRDSVELVKTKTEALMPADPVESVPGVDMHAWPALHAHHSSTIPLSAPLSRKHHSMCTLRPPSSSSGVGRDAGLRATPLVHRPRTAVQPQTACASDICCETPHRAFPLLPAKRATATAEISLADDILDFPPPIRTRSTRGWSASSGSPTAAESTAATSITTTSSGSRFQGRPPSLHTANTSVDLSAGAGSPSVKHAAHESSNLRGDAQVEDVDQADEAGEAGAAGAAGAAFDIDDYLFPDPLASGGHSESESESDTCPEPELEQPAQTELDNLDETEEAEEESPEGQEQGEDQDAFNIDDYLSSDAESLTTTTRNRRPTAAGEEELLLLSEAWRVGAGGEMQLPGLADVLAPSVGSLSSSLSSSPPSSSFPLMPELLLASVVEGRVGRAGRAGSLRAGPGRLGRADLLLQREGRREATRMSLPLDLSASLGLSRSLAAAMRNAGECGLGAWEGDEAGGGLGRAGVEREMRRERGSERAAVSDMDSSGESAFGFRGEPADGNPRTRGLAADGCAVDEGYEADYMGDEPEELARRDKQRSPRELALHRLEGKGYHDSDADGAHKDSVAAVVRLRKQIKRARRLAGQPTAAMVRRRGSRGRRSAERTC